MFLHQPPGFVRVSLQVDLHLLLPLLCKGGNVEVTGLASVAVINCLDCAHQLVICLASCFRRSRYIVGISKLLAELPHLSWHCCHPKFHTLVRIWVVVWT